MGLFKYVNDTRGEMKHVAWPTQKQTAIFTALVIAISLFTAAYLGFFDFLFTRSLELGLRATGSSESIPQYSSTSNATTTEGGPALPDGLDFSVEPVDIDSTGSEDILE